jgi:hypothetical protein
MYLVPQEGLHLWSGKLSEPKSRKYICPSSHHPVFHVNGLKEHHLRVDLQVTQ